MNVISFGHGACARTLRYLDSYISGELLVETNHEVLAHLSQCANCKREHELRVALRTRLRQAVHAEETPAGLEETVRSRIRAREAARFPWSYQVGLIAASLVLAVFAAWFVFRPGQALHDLDEAAQVAFIDRIAVRLPALLRAGLGDHLHCTVARKYPDNYPKPENIKPEKRLGAEFEGLREIVRRIVPEKYRLILAHRCGFKDRRFIHLTFRGDDAKLISLIVTRKDEGESFAAEQVLPALQQAGVPVYQRGVSGYQVAGFESRDYLAYLVSDLGAEENLQLTASIAAPVRAYLDRL